MASYLLIKWHVYKRLVLPWHQLISDLTRGNSANENSWSSVSWLRVDLTWRTLVKRKLEFNLLSSWRSVSWRPSSLNFGEMHPECLIGIIVVLHVLMAVEKPALSVLRRFRCIQWLLFLIFCTFAPVGENQILIHAEINQIFSADVHIASTELLHCPWLAVNLLFYAEMSDSQQPVSYTHLTLPTNREV